MVCLLLIKQLFCTTAAGAIDDTLYGGDGLDMLYGGKDRDSFAFEFASAFNDVDIINDFVQLTEASGNTTIAIDVNGTTGGSTYLNIAVLNGITGMDVNMMEDNNILIV